MFEKVKEIQRDIIANNSIYNNRFNYANNHIKTSKYSFLTFVPLNLFEQFQRLANFYFLCLLILQLIPVISSLTPVTTAVPLIGVLLLTGIKDAYDDIQRHRTDNQVNNRKSKVLRKGFLVEEKWHRVQVGDVIRMESNQFVAADVLLLSSHNPNGLCYIETAELDGETNLKARQCEDDTNKMGEDEQELSKFDGHIVCEAPNNNLSRFEGAMTWRGRTYGLDNDSILLRGAVLRNTLWCYGVVIFAGKDTKLMQNSGKTKFKRTSIDRLLNFIILGIVFFLVCMCLFCTIACGVWETLTGQQFQIYLPWDTLVPQEAVSGATVIALLVFFSYAIVLNTVVPISLYVSVEVIRLFMSFLISWDLKMYYAKTDTPARARTTTLNEELGQIEYIFSDKTGTLTQNIMTFNKCSIRGKSYGDVIDEITGEPVNVEDASRRVDFSWNPQYEPTFEFFDQALMDEVRVREDPDAEEFFRLLALCHTVMPEQKNGRLEYQAQSPDENALVSAARNFGFVFTKRTPRSITITAKQKEETYELLCILDFNNVRKRMSVIVKRDDKIRLYCKGADTIIWERLRTGQEELLSRTQDHLDKFASEGLRTLVLAAKDLTAREFETWKEAHHAAAIALDNRDDRLEEVYNQIEKDLTLLGATAIEDKLQDGVPQTIANLAVAGIKIWVLTGDKQETAINIGYACQLLTEELTEEPFIVDGETFEEVQVQLITHRNTMQNHALTNPALSKSHLHVGGSTHALGDGLHRDSVSMLTLSDAVSVSMPDGQTASSTVTAPSPSATAAETDPGLTRSGFALVVNGHSLVHALTAELEQLFFLVADSCTSVICCRVTPLQKAMVVELVKKYKKAVTLAIGDGANDVSMIKTAHIGVGISGQEGMQAVLASDYSIAQFKFLERLLLVHGRWSYYRMCKFLRYFFYKNFAFTLCHFWYAFFCGFSATTIFEPMFIAVYNLCYTSQPVLALGVFDQDVSAEQSLKYPKLYAPGLNSALFNKKEFFRSAAQGFITSCVLVFATYGAFHDKTEETGLVLSDQMLFGSVVATILIVVVTAQMALDTAYWTWVNHVTIWGSLAVYFILQFGYNYLFGGTYVGSLTMAMADYTFWFTCILTTVVLLMPVVAWRFIRADVDPTLTDKVRLMQRSVKVKEKKPKPEIFRPFSGRRSRRSVRSGYAFAHQEGFGRLITSGRIMGHQRHNQNVSSAPLSPVQESAPSTGGTSLAPGPTQATGGSWRSFPSMGNRVSPAPMPDNNNGRSARGSVNVSINGQVREVSIPNAVAN